MFIQYTDELHRMSQKVPELPSIVISIFSSAAIISCTRLTCFLLSDNHYQVLRVLLVIFPCIAMCILAFWGAQTIMDPRFYKEYKTDPRYYNPFLGYLVLLFWSILGIWVLACAAFWLGTIIYCFV